MITLHESNITSFPLDNGIGVLIDAIVAYTEEELNGMFEFYMEYDSEGHLVDELKEERIIKAKAQDKLGYQLFRIYSITKNHENDNLIIKAQHITYDLANNFVEELKAHKLTKKQVMEKIGSSTVEPHPFNVTSSNTTTVSSTNLYRTNPLQMVAGMEGSVLQIWGGQLERDNFNFILHDRRGHDDGVTVTFEKNITGLTAEFDISGVITRIFPFVFIEATDDEPERLITVDGKYIDSPHINDYEVIRTEPIDYSSDDRINTDNKTDAQIRQQLTNVAKNYFKETGNDKIKSEMEVQFAHLWETEEYKDVKVLELVGMGDTVTINHSKLKVDATAIVNYIKYDCIAQVNEEVKLGSVKARLTDNVNKIDTIERKVEQAQTSANQAIVSANGKNTTYYGPDEPTTGMQKGDLWFKVIDGQYHKTYRFDGIEWQLVIDMDSQEAKQEAQQAKDRADEAVNRANEATEQANESIEQAQLAFDKALESLDETAEIRTELGELSYTVTDNSTRINTLTITTDRLSGRLEKLDIRGYNFITHLPKLWEHGFYGITGVDDMEAGAKYDSDQLIRLSDKYRLEPNTDYVLSDHPELAREGHEYIETNLFLHLWNDDGSYSRYLVLNFRNEEHFITFKTSSTETHFSLHVMPTSPDVYLKPDDVHNVFFYKLALGTEKSGWTPNLDDTSELVSDVQNFVHDFSITAESLASRITDNEGRITTISSTVQGLQTTVSDVQGNVSNLTQLSTTLQSRLSDAEGNINELTLTSKSLSSRLESLGNPNLIVTSDFEHGTFNASTGEPTQTPYTNRLRSINFIDVLDASRFVASMQGVQQDISINFYQYDENYEYISHTGFKSFVEGKFDYIPPDRVKFFKMSIRFNDNRDIHIQDIIEAKIKLEAGDIITDYDRSYTSYAQISKLSDNINLRVAKGDVINQINLDTSGALISGKKLILDGDTTVTGTFKVNNANITSLNAGKITSGTLDAGKISVINLSANSIVGGILSSQNSNTTFNLNNGNLSMRQANFSLGGGANIEFLDRANKITYRFSSDRTRVAGLGVGVALGNEYPFAYLGTTGASELDTLSPYFSGFVANTTARIARDNSANSVYGKRFRFISDTDYNEGITIDFFNNYTTIESFGKYLNFGNLNHLYGLQGLTIRNYHNKTSGWLVETNYAGDGGAITLRGLSAGTYNYQIGSKSSRILNIYLRYNPDVLSDERLKTDISDIDLGLNFIKRIKAKQFKLKLTDADIIQGAQNKLQYGVIAQQVKSVLADFGVSDNSLITESEDGYYGAQYGQFIAPLIKSVQELDTKLTDNVELLKLKVQYLEQKIEQLEAS